MISIVMYLIIILKEREGGQDQGEKKREGKRERETGRERRVVVVI